MQLIEDSLLDLIAGGEMSTVTVIGYYDPPFDQGPYDPGPYDPNPGGSSGDSGGGGGSAPVYNPKAINNGQVMLQIGGHYRSALPAHTPNVSMDYLRDVARQAGNALQTLDKNIEHGTFIVKDQNGNLHCSETMDGDSGKIKISVDLQPGEQVVAYIHTHPDDPKVDERFPSTPKTAVNPADADTLQADGLRQKAGVDPNLLNYIVDDKSGHTFEYSAWDPIEGPRPIGADVNDDFNGQLVMRGR